LRIERREAQRAVDRGTKIAPQVRATIHEKLPAVADSGVELDALTKLPVEQQHEAVKLCEQWRKGGTREPTFARLPSVPSLD